MRQQTKSGLTTNIGTHFGFATGDKRVELANQLIKRTQCTYKFVSLVSDNILNGSIALARGFKYLTSKIKVRQSETEVEVRDAYRVVNWLRPANAPLSTNVIMLGAMYLGEIVILGKYVLTQEKRRTVASRCHIH